MPKTLTNNEMPKIGEKAPDFDSIDQDGKRISLKQCCRGSKKIICRCIWKQTARYLKN